MARERGINKTHQCCTGSPRSAPSHGNHSNRSGACCCPCPRAVPRHTLLLSLLPIPGAGEPGEPRTPRQLAEVTSSPGWTLLEGSP